MADSTALLFMVEQATRTGLVFESSLGEVFLKLSTASLQKLLQLPGLEQAVQSAWAQAGVEQLVAFALLDRYLRRRAPDLWRAGLNGVARETLSRLESGELPEERLILRLEGREQRRFQRQFPELWPAWSESWSLTAQKALRTLAARPRDVSLVNAEKLLSQQVYTEPGHFLLELLQNADDAGATCFEVQFLSDRVVVSHDGDPFDFRDLVGVLSIGQTTKTERQIGYFGVGFKSVFEVTERPRLQSGHFAFEIVDVSVPRALLPVDTVRDLTTLTLPLKQALSVQVYYEKALAIEPTLLLSLPHVETLHWVGPDGGKSTLSRQQEGGLARLSRDEQQQDYLVWRAPYRHQGERAEGKPAEAEVMVAFPLDGDGSIPPVNLFSFLPIQENSGLRFLLGSHFDVPVDRERLDQASVWNRGILARLPDMIEVHCQASPQQIFPILALLPLPTDSVGPLFRALSESLAERLREISFLPSASGSLKKAAQAVLLEEELLELFELDELARFVLPGNERTKAWLKLLGARSYDVKALLLDLVRGRAPQGLLNRDLSIWSHFHKLVLQDPSFETWGTQLRAVPLLLDHQGHLAAAKDLCLLAEDWEGIFEEPPATVFPALRELPETQALLASLQLSHFDWPHLLNHLREFGLQRVREDRLFHHLVEAPRAVQMSCLQLPLFRGPEGVLAPLTHLGSERDGLMVARVDTPVELFPDLRFCARLEPIETLLQAARWPYFERAEGLAYLHQGHWLPEPAEAELLCRWLLAEPSHWATLEDLQRLSCLRIFASRQGELRTLDELWLVEDRELRDHLPALPQLKDQGFSREVVEHFELRHWLRQATLDTLIEGFQEEDSSVVLAFLSGRADQLTRRQISKFLEKPLFEGQSVAHPENPPGPGKVEIAESDFLASFRELGTKVAGRDFSLAVAPLMKVAGFPLLGLRHLVEALLAAKPPARSLPILHEVLRSHALDLDLTFSEKLLQSLPLWLCADGVVRAADEIPPDSDIRELLQLQGYEIVAPRPQALAEVIPLLRPSEFVLNFVSESAYIGSSLEAQAPCFQTVEQVDRVAPYLPHYVLCVNAGGKLCARRLCYAPEESHSWLGFSEHAEELLHPRSSPWQVSRASPLPSKEVLAAFLPYLSEEPIRLHFYSYLGQHLSQIVGDIGSKSILLDTPLWRSAVGTFLQLPELVLEGELADLGYDWFPHSEIPESLLQQLKVVFKLGRSDSDAIFRNLLRAYLEALEQGRDFQRILAGLSKVTVGMSTQDLHSAAQDILGGREFPVWDQGTKTLRPLTQVYAPPGHLLALKAVRPVSADLVVFLRKMGLPYYPSPSLLPTGTVLSPEDSKALEDVIAWVWEERPSELDSDLEVLSRLPWMQNRAGEVKAPIQLYMPSSEVEDLLGGSLELYPAFQRPQGLWRALGLRGQDELSLPPVLENLQKQVAAGQVIGSHFYHFLENSLLQGQINPQFLRSSLAEVAWIWSDEGEHRLPKELVAFPAYRYFGTHRGTWERAHQRFPHLSRLFDIPEKLSPKVVLDFLREVHEGKISGCHHRLLKNALAYLGEKRETLPRDWRVLPARQFPELSETLVAAHTSGVVMSNSPTLAAIFGQGGTLWVVETDEPENGESLRALCRRLEIPELREAYTVRPDPSGLDLTEQMGESLASFRQLLRAVDRVLPRLQAARPEWGEGEWSVETRLRPFATTAPIRIIEPLELLYSLAQVSTVKVTAALAFDPESQRLLLSSQAAREPQLYALELAEGLADCIYQGPGSENLVDLLNLLLLFGSQERMNGYLDQRHFPRPFGEQNQGAEPWRRRLGEILDFGLQLALTRRFPELEGANWEAWRDAHWQAETGGVKELLARLGVLEPSLALQAGLKEMMDAPVLRLPTAQGDQEQASMPDFEESPIPPDTKSSAKASRFSRLGKKLFHKLTDLLATHTADDRAIRLKEASVDLAEHYQSPPERHLLVSSRDLQSHNLYCLDCLCSHFDAARQEYRQAWSQWPPLFLPSGETVKFSGSSTLPNLPLPLPLYSKLHRPPRLEGTTLVGPDAFWQYHLKLTELGRKITYEVELSATPDYQNSFPVLPVELSRGLLDPTVSLEQLPPLVRDWIEWTQSSGMPSWQLAERAEALVKDNYLYDLQYLDSEALEAVLALPLRPQENRFLSLLHAGAGGPYLGRGVCTELSALLLEILRHCGVPCALARVWMLDQGLIHVPDHVIVLALVPSSAGPYWLALDPSKQRLNSRQLAEEPLLTRLQLLEKAASMLFDKDLSLPEAFEKRERFLESVLGEVFGKPELLDLFLECLAKPGRYRKQLSPEFLELRERGFLEIKSAELYQIWVKH